MFVRASKYRELQKRNEFLEKARNHFYEQYMTAKSKVFPVLTDGEAEVLQSCLEKFNHGIAINVSMTRTAQFLKKLTDKGYLRRVKRGVYELTFVKNESNTVQR